MASVLYQCPTTGKNVQACFDNDTPADESLTYVSLRCPACARTWPRSRYVLGYAKEQPLMLLCASGWP
jgi:hypothetical protein